MGSEMCIRDRLSGQAETVGLASDGYLPGLRALYESLFSANEYQRIPVLSLLFAPALWVWLAALVGVGAASRRDRRTLALLALPVGCFLPLLLGACVLIRYAYPLVACVPLVLGCALARERREAR